MVDAAISAKSLVTASASGIRETAALADRVLAMTTFIPAATVKSEFEAADGALQATFAEFRGNALSPEVSAEVDMLAASYAAWRGDLGIVLGLEPASEVPTVEKVRRGEAEVTARIAAIGNLVDTAAISGVATTGDAVRGQIVSLLALALVAAIGSALAAFLVAGRITRPISKLNASMQQLAAGDAEVVIPPLQGAMEIRAMIGTVEIFRDGLVERQRLERDAEFNRTAAHEARVVAEAEAEAAAANRLRIATSGLADGLKRLASGDLAFQIDVAFAPEFEPLRHDFNNSVAQLAEVLAEISSNVDAISHGSHGINASANDLSRRTEQQAVSLDETAGALDEITETVNLSAKRTEEARRIAEVANTSAGASGEVVSQAVTAMGRIENSSQSISNIIGVIDEIAFQTNLLALNAGVEAARAGEAGRGFAVVAQEVRELAQRSAKAAKEIKQLIQNSSTEVATGVRLVSETGEALKVIENHIVSINGLMSAIAASASEQSGRLLELNSAVNVMDQVTQQNAAMVQEASNASNAMALEADSLRAQIARFNLGGHARQAGTRRAA
jgi:methyl-accepting chemotaxis protein